MRRTVSSAMLAVYLSALFCGPARATDVIVLRQEILAKYFEYPCEKFKIPKALAMAIARQESGMHPFAVNVAGKSLHHASASDALRTAQQAMSRGQSFDVGLMQVNSSWIRKYNIPLHILFNPGSNVYVGCWILKQEIDRHGMTWKAIGRYHSPTDTRANAYAMRVKRHLKNILHE